METPLRGERFVVEMRLEEVKFDDDVNYRSPELKLARMRLEEASPQMNWKIDFRSSDLLAHRGCVA